MSEPITFTAAVYKVQTLVDGGLRVTLDLPETGLLAAASLMACQRQGAVLEITAVAVVREEESDGL